MASKASHEYDQLPHELIFEILSRLQVKSLVRFMCVSKSWHSLISSPDFIKTHLKISSGTRDTAHHKLIFSNCVFPVDWAQSVPYITECKLNSALYDYPRTTEATDIRYPMYASLILASSERYDGGKFLEILGICNGLVCLIIKGREKCLFLWNPSIGKYRRVPYWDWGSDFQNTGISTSYGFGYDALHDDYKVVALASDYPRLRDKENGQVVRIYSQRTNSWKRNEDSEKYISLKYWHCFNGDVLFINGKLHWAVHIISFGNPANKIVTFDLADEIFGEIELPENMPKRSSYEWTTGVLGEGCLALLWLHKAQKLDIEIAVWIMTEYGVRESWTRMFVIHHPENHGRVNPLVVCVQPIFLTKKGEILLNLGRTLVLYNPKDNSYKDLQIRHNLPSGYGSLRVDVYDESLVLLDAHDGSTK